MPPVGKLDRFWTITGVVKKYGSRMVCFDASDIIFLIVFLLPAPLQRAAPAGEGQEVVGGTCANPGRPSLRSVAPGWYVSAFQAV